MITAAEAYMASLSHDEQAIGNEMKIVKNRIAISISNGKYECIIPRRTLLPGTIRALRALGYKVKKKGTNYSLSWRKYIC